MTAKKKAVKKADKKPVTGLVVPKHGRGRIYQGAPANPVAGTGRPPSEVRRRALGSFDNRLSVLEEIADDETAASGDRLRAVDVLGKYGLADTISRGEVRKALTATIAEVRQAMPPAEAEALVQAIRAHWVAL